MQFSIKNLLALLPALLCLSLSAQVTEGTTAWHNFAHGGFKVEAQDMQGYVMAGHRYFDNQDNHSIYISQFNESGQFQWTRTHHTGLNLAYVFWKSFCKAKYPGGYFILTSTPDAQSYAILTNATGQKLWERVSDLPREIYYKDVCPTPDGGYMACGDNQNNDRAEVSKFNAKGELVWSREYDDSGATNWWSIEPAVGGGFLLGGSGSNHVGKIDKNGELEWLKTLDAGIAPSGGHYTGGGISEIMVLPQGAGFIMTGSTSAAPYTDYYTAVYTARFDWDGNLIWVKVCDQQQTDFAPYKAVNAFNSIMASNPSKIITLWSKGENGEGNMYARTLDISNGAMGPVVPLNNTVPVVGGFATRAHGKLVVGGIGAGYSKVYAYTNAGIMSGGLSLPVPGDGTDEVSSGDTETLERNNLAAPEQALDLQVWPNPNTGIVHVKGTWESGMLLYLRDLNGRILLERMVTESPDAAITLDLSHLAAGMYILEAHGNQGITAKKLVKE